MKPTITIYIGSPLTGGEASFLRRLQADLADTEGIILANFFVEDQQIDFLVVTAAYPAAILELKNFQGPIFGEKNGFWSLRNLAGKRVRYPGINPYQQAVNQKYKLSDLMGDYQEKTPGVPPPSGRRFFQDFTAFVCVFPEIHPDSEVTRGDHKAAVRSYPEILEQLRTGSKPSSWSLSDWREFAENALALSAVTLQEAIDMRVFEAYEKTRAYRCRVKEEFAQNLPPLIGSGQNPNSGQDLVARLLEPRNHLLVGPSGSAKTFHLRHLMLALADSGPEAPIFVEAKKYRGGDFWTLLKHSIAPLFGGDPRQLLEAIRLTGALPVLVLDALNECGETHLADLLHGAQAFVLHFGARTVVTSQYAFDLPADLQATPELLPLPDSVQKRLIYSHHAGVQPAAGEEGFFEGFTNAYDLTVAGRCFQSGSPAASRTDLYDRYVRERLPRHASVAAALLRFVACEMAKSLATAWSRDLFETTAERFLIDKQGPLGVLDEMRACRLVELTNDSFSFEHEILFNYFKADALRRNTTVIEDLAAELQRPRNQQLLAFVLPRYSDPVEIAELLSATGDVEVLSQILRGQCGQRAAAALIASCEALLDTATQDVARVGVTFQKSPDGPSNLSITGTRDWSDRDAALCAVIAQNLHEAQLEREFLKLLDATEWKLKTASRAAARSAGLKLADVWEEIVRLYGGLLQHGKLTLPCSAILSALRMTLMGVRRFGAGLAIREPLIQRTRKNPESHFGLLMLLQDHDAAGDATKVQENIQLVEQSLNSQVYILQVDALEYLQLMRSTLEAQHPEELPHIREMIEAIDRNHIMLNTAIAETLASYDFLAPLVTPEDASSEVRKVISVGIDDPELIQLATMFGMSPSDCLASRAYGCISSMFEDVFQGVYWDAYSELSNEEKGLLLYLASQSPERGSSFDWILAELLRYGGPQALPAFQRFAAGVEEQCFVQEAITCFALGIQGCALHSGAPPPYTAGDSPAHQAWQIVGEILYWRFKGADAHDTRFEPLWARFQGSVRLAVGDVFYQLRHARNWHFRNDPGAIDLIAAFPEKVGTIIETCLPHRDALPSIFQYGGSRDRNVVCFLIDTLGQTGGHSSIPLLEALVEDLEFGKDSIRAIEKIHKRIGGACASFCASTGVKTTENP